MKKKFKKSLSSLAERDKQRYVISHYIKNQKIDCLKELTAGDVQLLTEFEDQASLLYFIFVSSISNIYN